MPIQLPNRPSAKAIERNHERDRLAIAALCVGLLAFLVAAFVYVTVGDRFIVSYILLVASAIVALILRWNDAPPARN